MNPKDDIAIYHENFLFRTRTLHLKSDGVLIIENSFLKKGETFLSFGELGTVVQYRSMFEPSDLILSALFTFLGALVIYARGNDLSTLILGLILLSFPIRWAIKFLIKTDYIGTVYVVHSPEEKPASPLEIKSKYPFNEELRNFMIKLREAQTTYVLQNQFMEMTSMTLLDQYLSEALVFKNNLGMDEEKYQVWVEQIKNRYASLPEAEDW